MAVSALSPEVDVCVASRFGPFALLTEFRFYFFSVARDRRTLAHSIPTSAPSGCGRSCC
jgi:hypothetical protein